MAVVPSVRTLVARVAAVSSVVLVVGSLTMSPASAATSVGSTFLPPNGCSANFTFVQTTSPPGTSYAVPAAGVITSWQFQAAAVVPQIKFKAFRPTSAASFTVIGSSDVVAPTANQLNSFPIRVPVLAGDLIGLATLSGGPCGMPGSLHFIAGDAAVGSNQPYTLGAGTMDVAALVEPDSDGDGYGDETQDLCATQATTHGACDLTPPDTEIIRGPQSSPRTTVRFVFVSDDPGARFECRLKGKKVRSPQLQEYRSCSSPKTFKHLKVGGYSFQARAIDAAGNRDRTRDKWRFRVTAR